MRFSIDARKLLADARREVGEGEDPAAVAASIKSLSLGLSILERMRRLQDWRLLFVHRGSLQIMAGRAAEVVAEFLPRVQKGGRLAEDRGSHATLAQALIADHRASEAIAHLAPLLGAGGLLERDAVAHTIYAYALMGAGRSVEAVRLLETAVHPGGGGMARDPYAHVAYAKALVHAHRAADAVRHLHPAIQAGGWMARNPHAQLAYARALLADGRRETATNHLVALTHEGELLARNPRAYDLLDAIAGERQPRTSDTPPRPEAGRRSEDQAATLEHLAHANTREDSAK